MVPEDVGRKAAHLLLEEISRGGVTDGTHQVTSLTKACLLVNMMFIKLVLNSCWCCSVQQTVEKYTYKYTDVEEIAQM